MKKKEKSIFAGLNILNDSKFFAGLVILVMNIGSKYISVELSKTQENYIKYSLGRQILIFAIIWMGTRDIVTSLIMTIIFIMFADYLFNEHSKYCIIPDQYKELNMAVDVGKTKVTQKEVNDAIQVLKLAHKLKKDKDNNKNIENTLYKENFI